MERCCASNIGVNGTGLIYSKILFHFKLSACGALVDEAALMAASDRGQLSAAGLDCFQVEPGGNPAISSFDNIFMLPHIGSATRQTRDAMGFRALENLDAFFTGKTLGDRL